MALYPKGVSFSERSLRREHLKGSEQPSRRGEEKVLLPEDGFASFGCFFQRTFAQRRTPEGFRATLQERRGEGSSPGGWLCILRVLVLKCS
jgi:hypothetical protein